MSLWFRCNGNESMLSLYELGVTGNKDPGIRLLGEGGVNERYNSCLLVSFSIFS